MEKETDLTKLPIFKIQIIPKDESYLVSANDQDKISNADMLYKKLEEDKGVCKTLTDSPTTEDSKNDQ